MSDSSGERGRLRSASSAATVIVVGSSFRTAGVEAREGIAERLHRGIGSDAVLLGPVVSEFAAVETCNRLELYAVSDSPESAAIEILARLGAGEADGRFYVRQGVEAIAHLFRVAAGLDSPVLGEEQILEQVRDAGRKARTSGSAKSVLSSLFDAAHSSGSRVRRSYRIPAANRSVSAFALRHALIRVGRRPSGVLLIGSGETAKLAALRLKGSDVYLLSSRPGAGSRFPGAVSIPRRKLREAAAKCDLVVAATRRQGYSLTRNDLPYARKMVILDLGFPRNVDPSVRRLSYVTLYDLDSVAAWALSRKHQGASPMEQLVMKEARKFDAWLTASRLTPTLANVYRWGERVRKEETDAALRKLPALTSHEKEIVEALSRRITGKLLSPHANFVKNTGPGADQSERLVLVESIFKEGT